MEYFRLSLIFATLCVYFITLFITPGEGINIVHGRARSHARGKNGATSLSDVETYGYHAGIRHANGQYQTLHQQSGSRGRSFNGGPGSPQTWANGGSAVGPGGSRGGVQAGFRGGEGRATAQQVSQQHVIPLAGGATLYHNLPKKKTTRAASEDWEENDYSY